MLTSLTCLGVYQAHSSAQDLVPLHLPDSLSQLRQLRELGVSLPGWSHVIEGLTWLTRLMVRHIHTYEHGTAYLKAFYPLTMCPHDPYGQGSLELSSDTEMVLNGGSGRGVYHWAVPETPFK